MKKLYEVKIRIIVTADDKNQAEEISTYSETLNNLSSLDVDSIREIKSQKDIPHEWLNSIPFGSENDIRCKDFSFEQTNRKGVGDEKI